MSWHSCVQDKFQDSWQPPRQLCKADSSYVMTRKWGHETIKGTLDLSDWGPHHSQTKTITQPGQIPNCGSHHSVLSISIFLLTPTTELRATLTPATPIAYQQIEGHFRLILSDPPHEHSLPVLPSSPKTKLKVSPALSWPQASTASKSQLWQGIT